MAVKFITIGEIKTRLKELEDKVHHLGEDDEDAIELSCEEHEEMVELRALRHDLNWGWEDDSRTLIRGDDFTEFVQEMLYDIDDVRKGGVCDGLIDWDKAAEIIEQDYKSCTYDQEQYFTKA